MLCIFLLHFCWVFLQKINTNYVFMFKILCNDVPLSLENQPMVIVSFWFSMALSWINIDIQNTMAIIAPFWTMIRQIVKSMEQLHHWTVSMPFWFSADDVMVWKMFENYENFTLAWINIDCMHNLFKSTGEIIGSFILLTMIREIYINSSRDTNLITSNSKLVVHS